MRAIHWVTLWIEAFFILMLFIKNCFTLDSSIADCKTALHVTETWQLMASCAYQTRVKSTGFLFRRNWACERDKWCRRKFSESKYSGGQQRENRQRDRERLGCRQMQCCICRLIVPLFVPLSFHAVSLWCVQLISPFGVSSHPKCYKMP